MATGLVVPVLLKDGATPGVITVIALEDAGALLLEGRTVSDLIELLDTKLSAMERPDANEINVVTAIRLYGTALSFSQPLAPLVLELSSSMPRFVATTQRVRLSGSASDVPLYVKTLTLKTLHIRCDPRLRVQQVMKAIYDTEGIPPDQQRLMFQGKNLDEHESLAEYGVVARSTLHLILKLRGGGVVSPAAFADVSNESLLVQQAFSATAPKWRGCNRGLNIEGRCETQSCEAFGKMVISPVGFTMFNLMGHENVRCPLCDNAITPVTCGFYDCVWKFEGVRASDQSSISSLWKQARGKQYHRFEADETNGSITWTSLLIVVKTPEAARAAGLKDQEEHSKDTNYALCSICWSDMDRTCERTTTPCGHSFHGGCIREWSKYCNHANTMASCPLCRTPL